MVDIKDIEKICLSRIETTMNYEKDPNLQKQIEESGKTICKWMSEQSIDPGVIQRVMNAAIRAIPTYTKARQEHKKIAWSGDSTNIPISDKLRVYAMRTFGIEIKEVGLTEEDKTLLCRIKEAKRIADLQKGRIRKPTDFDVDEEFSKLCSKQFE